MIFHYMLHADSARQKNLKTLFDKIDECGYYSVLLTYSSHQNDLWVKSINLINPKYKFKFQPAIRTYAITPEYFAMIYNACEEISPNKYMFNIISGNLWNNTENTLENIVWIKDLIDTPEKRLDYTLDWIEKLKKSNMITRNFPEIVMSGVTDQTLQNAAAHADYTLPMLSDFIDDPKKFMVTKKVMVCGAIVIRDSFEEAERVVDQGRPSHQKMWTLYGTESDILKEIKKIKDLGCTDFMIRQLTNDKEIYRIHDFVKKYKDFVWETI